jgi:hypothetical protein
MILAIFIAKPLAPVAKYQLSVIKRQFAIVIIKFVLFCFFSCWAAKLHKKGTPSELRSWLFKCFLISLGFFAGMYGLFMVEFVMYCTMDGDPNVGQTEWDSIFCIKLLFWEMLVIYNLMLIYGIFNFGYLKERSLSKFDQIDATSKEGGQFEDMEGNDLEVTTEFKTKGGEKSLTANMK